MQLNREQRAAAPQLQGLTRIMYRLGQRIGCLIPFRRILNVQFGTDTSSDLILNSLCLQEPWTSDQLRATTIFKDTTWTTSCLPNHHFRM